MPMDNCGPKPVATHRSSHSPSSWRLAGLIGFLLIIASPIATNRSVANFVDWQGIVFVVGGTACLTLTAFGRFEIRAAFRALVSGEDSEQAARSAVSVFKLAAAFALICGFVSTIIGLISILCNLSEPSRLGPATAFALLSQFYGMLLATGAYVAAVTVARRACAPEAEASLANSSLIGAGAATVAGGSVLVLIFLALILSLNWM